MICIKLRYKHHALKVWHVVRKGSTKTLILGTATLFLTDGLGKLMQVSRTVAAVDARFIQVTSRIASSHNKLGMLNAIVRGVDLIAYLLLREENQIIPHKPSIA